MTARGIGDGLYSFEREVLRLSEELAFAPGQIAAQLGLAPATVLRTLQTFRVDPDEEPRRRRKMGESSRALLAAIRRAHPERVSPR